MTHIIVLGAGLGGSIMAYELADLNLPDTQITTINRGATYQFVPSNPWVAVGWRARKDVETDLHTPMTKRGITLEPVAAARVHPAENRVELEDGRSVSYDYLVIATGPDLAFDEIEGFGPAAHTISVCQTPHAEDAHKLIEQLKAKPGPVIVGAVQGASCFGPAYEFAFILDTELKRHKIRDQVPMTFITSEPYIGHLGLDGVGDTKGLLESEMRQRHIKWITNARVTKFEANKAFVEELAEDGSVKTKHEVPFALTMMLPAFRGVPAVHGIEGLTNPRGFITIDEFQRNPTYPNVFGIGVCVAIPPMGKTPVPVGVPKTGFMIESMVTATAKNIEALIKGEQARFKATWNAVCLADFGDGGVAFVAQPQLPPRNVNWASHGRWVHMAKIGFEKYFLHKVSHGISMPFYEKLALDMLGITKLKEVKEEK